MRIEVHLHTILQRFTVEGMVGQLEVDMPEGSTLEDLLSHLAIELEPESLLLVVNGRNEEKSYVLSEMDKVNLMPVLSGGCL